MASNDILGPASAPGAVVVRPNDDRTFALLDSWFADCTSIDINDGTEYHAAFFNGLIASLRAVWRMNGGTIADPATKIVPEIGFDDTGLARAIQHLVQRGQTNFATDTGIANAMVVSLAPALVEYKSGVYFNAIVKETNTGATVVNVNGLGNRAVVKPNGDAMHAGGLYAGAMVTLRYDGTKFQCFGFVPAPVIFPEVPKRQYAPITLYVSPTGSNANPGTLAQPFQTLSYAYRYAQQNFDMNGYQLTIKGLDGFHTAGMVINGRVNGVSSVLVEGNVTAPAACVVSTNDICFNIAGGVNVYVRGFKVASSGAHGFLAVGADNYLNYSDIEFGYCAGNHVFMSGAQGGQVGNSTISGGANSHWCVLNGNFGTSAPVTTTLLGTPAFNTFAYCNHGGLGIPNLTYVGGATGKRFDVTANGVISSNAGGASAFPGSIAGTSSYGGQYIL